MADQTLIRKVHNSAVLSALQEFTTRLDVPEGYYIKELVPRVQTGGWLIVMEPRTLSTPPALPDVSAPKSP